MFLDLLKEFLVVITLLQLGCSSLTAVVFAFYYKLDFEKQFYRAFKIMLPYSAVGVCFASITALFIAGLVVEQ